MAALSVKNISKFYGTTCALNRVSFALKNSDLVLLVGPNGSGKSTLLGTIAGLIRPDEGEVELDGKPCFGAHRRSRLSARIGYVGARTMLYDQFSIRENLELSKALSSTGRGEADIVEKIISRFGLEPFAKKTLSECSQGVRRKAAIGRALVLKPELLLLDEPFTNLDQRGKDELQEFLREAQTLGTTCLVATHEADIIQAHSGRRLTLEQGRIEEEVR